MFIRSLGRCGALLFAVLISGCSMLGLGSSDGDERRNECRWSRSSCMYEGAYDPGERDYAVEEAARLNRAELKRFRRSTR